jgi:hypothetical protein
MDLFPVVTITMMGKALTPMRILLLRKCKSDEQFVLVQLIYSKKRVLFDADDDQQLLQIPISLSAFKSEGKYLQA